MLFQRVHALVAAIPDYVVDLPNAINHVRLEGLRVLAPETARFCKVNFEPGALGRVIVWRPLQGHDGVERVFLAACAALSAAFTGMVSREHRTPRRALAQHPFLDRAKTVGFVFFQGSA